MREITITHLFKFPVEIVYKTYFEKYADGRDPNIKSIDVLERHIDQNGVETVKRRAVLENIVPWYLQFFIPGHCIMEEVVVRDVKERMFSTHTYNVTWADTAAMVERTTYTRHADNPQWTDMKQSGTLECKKCPDFAGGTVEAIVAKFLTHGAYKASVFHGGDFVLLSKMADIR
ncbi:hypothetical protein CAOG_007795 [Capsaspora owczarzaki ATCC 30864]|uniref:PRELI/MSF1 domain-containing protein n=1 Tax=Capsaspora owczarzaki (strain ATCC 30864) TaxID=595528 RepID=A0A0D2WX58_CAPO3|nr:hypothetical protein CAOG_007795 [Capsaspora owczarzaki ATCC 30864]